MNRFLTPLCRHLLHRKITTRLEKKKFQNSTVFQCRRPCFISTSITIWVYFSHSWVFPRQDAQDLLLELGKKIYKYPRILKYAPSSIFILEFKFFLPFTDKTSLRNGATRYKAKNLFSLFPFVIYTLIASIISLNRVKKFLKNKRLHRHLWVAEERTSKKFRDWTDRSKRRANEKCALIWSI